MVGKPVTGQHAAGSRNRAGNLSYEITPGKRGLLIVAAEADYCSSSNIARFSPSFALF